MFSFVLFQVNAHVYEIAVFGVEIAHDDEAIIVKVDGADERAEDELLVGPVEAMGQELNDLVFGETGPLAEKIAATAVQGSELFADLGIPRHNLVVYETLQDRLRQVVPFLLKGIDAGFATGDLGFKIALLAICLDDATRHLPHALLVGRDVQDGLGHGVLDKLAADAALAASELLPLDPDFFQEPFL